MQPTRDYYELLGISRDASAGEVHRAFRARARQCHPDVSTRADAAARFHELSTAYAVLRDPRKRGRYDREVPAARPSRPSSRPSPAGGPIVIRLSAVLRWRS